MRSYNLCTYYVTSLGGRGARRSHPPFQAEIKLESCPTKPHNLLFLILFIFAEPTMDPSLLQNGSALFEKTIDQNKFGMASMLQ